MKITLRNDYHNTRINLVVADGGELSQSQIKRAKRALCWSDCECSGPLGVRGPQDVTLDEFDASSYDTGYHVSYIVHSK